MQMAANLAGMAFVPYYNHIMQLLDTDKDLKKTAKGIFHQMAYAGSGAAIGGIFAGPPGALVGGIVGSIAGYWTVSDYDNLIKVLRSLGEDQQQRLVRRVQELVGSTGLEALTSFVGQQVNREMFVHLARTFANEVSKGG